METSHVILLMLLAVLALLHAAVAAGQNQQYTLYTQPRTARRVG
jgi:hypothetical protein